VSVVVEGPLELGHLAPVDLGGYERHSKVATKSASIMMPSRVICP
jgi:hypothetical protein